MTLIATEASIKYGGPDYDGMVEQFGLSRDWRPSELWRGYNCEYIKPLGAIGPVADVRPRSMDAADWEPAVNWNTSWVERYPALVDSVRCLQFTGVLDPATKAPWLSTDDAHDVQGLYVSKGTWCESILPRFALYVIRSMPPAGQGVPSHVHVEVPGTYNDDGTYKACVVSIYLPLAGDSSEAGKKFSAPFIHLMPVDDIGGDGYFSLFSEGQQLATGGQASSMRQGAGREGWIVEYQDDTALFDGGHILIRQTSNPGDWWHFHDPRVYLSRKDDWDALGITDYGDYYLWKIGASGAVQTVNLTPLLYGAAEASCWPEKTRPLPHEVASNEVDADAWYDTANVGQLITASSGWTVASALTTDGRSVGTTFTPPASPVNRRPILWFSTEDYTPQFTAAETDPRTDIDTDEVMRSLVWTWGKDFKGSRGTATFSRRDTASYPAWEERASCVLRMGWNAEAGGSLVKQDITQAYIVPGGMPRDRDGEESMGAPGFGPVQFGAFDVAILQDKPLIDMRQAGGMTVTAWASMIAGRIGIPSAKVYVDPAVASTVIPVNEIPSKPHLAPGDGESAATHIAAVEQAASIRVCWNKTTSYVMWVDGGSPAYDPETSTIALEIDYDTLVQEDIAFRLQHGFTRSRSANALKVRYGRDDAFGGQSEFYSVQPLAQRQANLKGDFWAYYEDPDASKAQLIARYEKERKGGDAQLDWTMPLRVDLRPDMFVKVTDCPYLGIVTDAVYQIEEHTANQPAAESELSAVRVYVADDALSMMATSGEFGGMHANLDLDVAATEGALGEYEGITGLPTVGTSGAFDDDGASDDVNDQATLGYLED